ncbi:trypsin-like peptidase domain-containing protein [Roseobacteraceae bacterium S113]
MKYLLLLLALLVQTPLLAQSRVPTSAAEIQLSFAPLVKQAAPAVVNIYARRVVEARRSPFSNDPFFREFFRGFGDTRPRVQNSLGSGVVLSEDGIVVSNFHVVGQATDIRVVFNDRQEYRARVLLGDEESDLAILQLEGAEDLPHLSLRDSDTVEVGELVLAIGNPFGVGQTVTSGIVSGLARSGTATGNARGYFIQTDAPINPGNSGGALVDVSGGLIGINTSILTRSGGSNGIGFAIPASLVAQFVKQARAGAQAFQRPWAGITGQAVDGDLADSLGLIRPGGVVLSDLHPVSPFAAAGLAPGDVVIEVDGQPINTPPEMLFRMSIQGIGARIAIAYLSAGMRREAEIDLILPPDVPDREAIVLAPRDILEGVELALVNPSVGAELGLSFSASGVVVTAPGPLGRRVGLQRGDIVEQVNDFAIERPSDLGSALRAAGNRIAMQVSRQGRRVVLRFRL